MEWSHCTAGCCSRKLFFVLPLFVFFPAFLLAQCFGSIERVVEGSGSFTVPSYAQYFILRVTAIGADGGDYPFSGTGTGGSGARMVSEFLIKGGSVLEYHVGGAGGHGANDMLPRAGGGGGGTAIVLNDDGSRRVLIAAGAGGGSGGSNQHPDHGAGGIASLVSVPAGGTSMTGFAAGGGGFMWPGGDGFAGSTGGGAGTLVGGLGEAGMGVSGAGDGGVGFGGGGGAAGLLGGGGGGYRGGNGGGRISNTETSYWGKGGHSYISQSPDLMANPITLLIVDGVDGDGLGRDGQILIECASVLPVELLSFGGEQGPKGVLLDWATSAEVNNEGFEVQHSEDGIIWQKAGFVSGKGTTTAEQAYHFIHKEAVNGLNYYRLKQMDLDGAFEFSEIISVLTERPEELTCFPNPTSGQLTLSGPDVEGALVEISNQFGKVVKKARIQRGTLDLSELPAGVYLLQVHAGEQEYVRRIAKE